jgi:hypothetical protein
MFSMGDEGTRTARPRPPIALIIEKPILKALEEHGPGESMRRRYCRFQHRRINRSTEESLDLLPQDQGVD